MRSTLLVAMMTALSMNATVLTDGEINEGSTGDSTTGIARVWDLGGGLTMTISGFSLIGSSFIGANTTQFNQSGIGLGVCGINTENCYFNQWQMDNAAPGGRDFVLVTFSLPVDLINFTIRQTGLYLFGSADSDWSYAFAAGTPGAGNGSLSVGSLTNVNGAVLSAGSFDTRTIAGANAIRSLLLGVGPASSSCGQDIDDCDYFKLYDINVRASSTPEPGSMGLLGLGLLGLGIAARRLRK